jgi:lipoteichoic acid synthase
MLRAVISRHFRTALFAAIFLAYLAVLFGVAGIRDPGHPARSLVRAATALVEVVMAGLLCAGCMRAALRGRPLPWLLVSTVIACGIAVAYLAQVYSLYISRNFISVLAMQNADSVAFVESTLLQVGAGLVLAWTVLFWTASRTASRLPRVAQGIAVRWSGARYALALVACGLPFAYLLFIQGNGSRLEPGFRQSPVASLAVATYRYRHADLDGPPLVQAGGREAGCFAYADAGSAYPFLRKTVFQAPLPFARNVRTPSRQPNIIIIFAEGVSARMLGVYGGHHPGLTPALDRLAMRTMRVDGYYNHTAATFRGLEGQLSSGFSFAGGSGKEGWNIGGNRSALARIRRQSLPRVVNEAGYESHMFVPHRSDRPLIRMLEALGFTRVHAYESIDDELLGGRAVIRPGTGAIDDRSLFHGVRTFLERRAAAGDKRPFLLATYNIGTHAFLRHSPGELAYGGVGNPVLDKMHNLDGVLGDFLRYFFSSPYADDTLLVVTADHATYPEPAYREVAGEGLKPYFVDRIPLFVYDPFHRLPATWDAQGRNSLDLAPTVLHLAGMQAQQNAFLGRSLFESRSLPVGIAAVESNYFMTLPDEVFAMDEIPPSYRDVFQCEMAMVRRFYAAERENRIMPSQIGRKRVAEATRQPAAGVVQTTHK